MSDWLVVCWPYLRASFPPGSPSLSCSAFAICAATRSLYVYSPPYTTQYHRTIRPRPLTPCLPVLLLLC